MRGEKSVGPASGALRGASCNGEEVVLKVGKDDV